MRHRLLLLVLLVLWSMALSTVSPISIFIAVMFEKFKS